VKRISRTSIDAHVLRQSRNIRTWFVFGLALLVVGGGYALDAFVQPYNYASRWMPLIIAVPIIGLAIIMVSTWMIGRLPSATNTRIYETGHKHRAIIEVAPGRLMLPAGISQPQWDEIKRIVAVNDWRFSRQLLYDNMPPELRLTNEQYTVLFNAVTAANVVVNNRVPDNARRMFLAPQMEDD
jgi:hypothetical protein